MSKSKVGTFDEILYGFHSVFEALKAKKRTIKKLFLAGNFSDKFRHLISMSESLSITCEVVKSSKIKSLSKVIDHQGVCAVVSPLPMFFDVESFFDKEHLAQGEPCLLVILDSILDPHNFGAIVRTAYCAGASCVITTKDRACYPTPSVSKISAGALEHLPVCRVTNLSNSIKTLKKKDFWILGMGLGEKTSNIFDLNVPDKVAIVTGNEKKGIRPLVGAYCDFMVSIPMLGQLNSLNASVATGVVLYEIFRKKTFL